MRSGSLFLNLTSDLRARPESMDELTGGIAWVRDDVLEPTVAAIVGGSTGHEPLPRAFRCGLPSIACRSPAAR